MRKGAFVLVAGFSLVLLGCGRDKGGGIQTMGPTPTPNPPPRVTSASCQTSAKCTVQIFFDAQSKPAVDIDDIIVRQNADIWWILLPQGCDFGAANGILLKDPSSDDGNRQFDKKYVADDNENQLPINQRGRRYHWRDKHVANGQTGYEINFACTDTSTNPPTTTPYHIDPTINNG